MFVKSYKFICVLYTTYEVCETGMLELQPQIFQCLTNKPFTNKITEF